MTRRFAALCLAALAACFFGNASAEERILAYDSEVSVNTDGSLDVVERIRVRAEGTNIRRGIYRDFPTRYKDRRGNRVVVGFEMKDVLRDGKPEPWFTERHANGIRINTGNDDFLPVPADYTYTLRYRTTRQLGFFAAHDELYWNAIGTGWDFPIDAGDVDVRLPAAVPASALQLEAYTGAQGLQGHDYTAGVVAPGHAHWALSRALAPNEGLTIVLGFPKGVVTEPTRSQRLWWLLKDNRGILIALATLLALLVYCLRQWRTVGRDPRAGVVIARYEPPKGHSPAGLRYLRRMSHDARCFSSDLLALAVQGFLRIEREDRLLADDWRLVRTRSGQDADVPASERALLGVFADGGTVELEKSNATRLQAVQQAQEKALKQAYEGRMFKRNGKQVGIAFCIALAGTLLALFMGGGGGVPIVFLLGVLMVPIVIVFAFLVRAHTAEGRALLDETAGLALYLGVAEKDELARMPGPEAPPLLDAERYQRLLPYAVALEVEDAWTKKFTAAVGAAAAAAATAGIAWYRGGGANDLASLTHSIGNSFTSQIASSSTPPGCSSGGGGGGSSGGGGGGGGGGGR